MAYKKKVKKTRRHVDSAVAHIKSSFNNTIVTLTTDAGDVLITKSAGALGFKGSRKGTPYAASQVAAAIAKDAEPLGIKTMEVNMRGPGSGRESVVRAFQAAGFNITMLRDVTPLPHNGCRAPKKRRV
jgi:small subunit ribosomal protein S11